MYAAVVLETAAAPDLRICVFELRSSHARTTWLIILPERQSTGGSTWLGVLLLTSIISTTLFFALTPFLHRNYSTELLQALAMVLDCLEDACHGFSTPP